MKQITYHFAVEDYLALAGMLLLSAFTGVYIAYKNGRKKNKSNRLTNYLIGNKNLKLMPVAISLISSFVSGITILGTPAEIYNYGIQYWMITVAMILSGFVIAFVYVPVFVNLQVCSSYEYLELRFSKSLRNMASIFFLINQVLFLPVLIYVPSLALNQVTGLNVHAVSTVICAICVFYVYLGGLKAVVYTDVWQAIVMFIAMIVIVSLGVVKAGGMYEIMKLSFNGHRIQPLNFSTSMYERYTVFNILIGGCIYFTSYNGVNQTMVQRYLSLPTLKKTKISIALFVIGTASFISLCCFFGLVVYSTYADCDPVHSKRIVKYDQIMPLFVMETASHLPGVPGIFIAGVFGAALSSLSVALNSSSVVFLEDFLRGMCRVELSERVATMISKIVIVVLGCLAVALMFVVQQLRGVLEITMALTAITSGTMFGIFSLGMLVPWANNFGATAGGVLGFLVSSFISFGTQFAATSKMLASHSLPVSVDRCEEMYGLANITLIAKGQPDESNVFPLFRLSYLWITPIGSLTAILVGIIVSFATRKTDIRYLDPELISPVFQWLLPEEAQNYAGTAVKKIAHQRLLRNDKEMDVILRVSSNGKKSSETDDEEDTKNYVTN